MSRPVILIYVIITGAIAVCSAILEIQPALFFIDLMAPNPGDRYSVTGALVLTWFIFLAPLAVLLLITKTIRSKANEEITPDRTGVFVTRQKSFQSALIGIPIYINSKKVGVVDNGKTKFFDVPIGDFIIQAGKEKQASEKLEGKIGPDDQLNFNFSLEQNGLFIKIVLTETSNDNSTSL